MRFHALLLAFSCVNQIRVAAQEENSCESNLLGINYLLDKNFTKLSQEHESSSDFDRLIGWWVDGSSKSIRKDSTDTIELFCSKQATGIYQYIPFRISNNASLVLKYTARFVGSHVEMNEEKLDYRTFVGAAIDVGVVHQTLRPLEFITREIDISTTSWQSQELVIENIVGSYVMVFFSCTGTGFVEGSYLEVKNPHLGTLGTTKVEPLGCPDANWFKPPRRTLDQSPMPQISSFKTHWVRGKLNSNYRWHHCEETIRTLAEERMPTEFGLAYHASVDRIDRIAKSVNLFDGKYVSVALFTPTGEKLSESKARSVAMALVDKLSQTAADRIDLTVVVVSCTVPGCDYPINMLRNMAMASLPSEASWVVNLDADLLPSAGMSSRLLRRVSHSENITQTAFVIPTFEQVNQQRRSDAVHLIRSLKSKDVLLRQLDRRSIVPYKQGSASRAHGPTNFEKWRSAQAAFPISYVPQFEPFVAVLRGSPWLPQPPFDGSFVGYGWNKIGHIMALHSMNYSFVVLPDVYLIHEHHPKTESSRKFSYDVSTRFRNRARRYFAIWQMAYKMRMGPCNESVLNLGSMMYDTKLGDEGLVGYSPDIVS